MASEFSRTKERRLSGAVIAVLGLVLAVLSFYRIRDPDIWLYLKSGEAMWDGREILTRDVFSYTRPDAPWINHSWGAQVLFYLAFRTAGPGGLYAARFLLLAGAFGGIYLCVRRKLAPPWSGLLVLAGIFGASQRFVVRPELFSFLGLAWLLYLLERGGRSLRLLPLLFWAWANLHGGFVLGFLALGAWTAGAALERLLRGRASPFPRELPLLVVLSALAAMATPNGPGGLFYTEKVGQVKNYIYVWQPFLSSPPSAWSLSQWFFPILLLSVGASFLAAGRRTRIPVLLLYLGFGALGFSANRNIFVFALISPFLAASNLGGRRLPGGVRLFFPLAAAAAAAAWIYPRHWADPYGSNLHNQPGWGICRTVYPTGTAAFIEKEGLEARIFNTFGIGSYLAWRLWPGQEIFLDTRVGVYGENFLMEYNRVLVEPGTFPELAGRWGFHLALADHANPSNRPLLRWLANSPDWDLAGYDADSALFVATAFPESSRIAADGMEAAEVRDGREAFAAGKFLLSIGRTGEARARLEAAARERPDSSAVNSLLARAWADQDPEKAYVYCLKALSAEDDPALRLLAAHLLASLGHPEQAEREAAAALAEAPGLPEGFALLGDLAALRGARAEALAAYRRGAQTGKLPPESALAAGRLLLEEGNFAEAAGFFASVAEGEPGRPEASVSLAGCLARIGQREKAEELYRRGIRDYPELADLCRFNLASLLAEEGKGAEARELAREISDPALRRRAPGAAD